MYHNHHCHHCGSDVTITLSSIDQIICNVCKSYSSWRLKPNQPSVLCEGKVGESDAESSTEPADKPSL